MYHDISLLLTSFLKKRNSSTETTLLSLRSFVETNYLKLKDAVHTVYSETKWILRSHSKPWWQCVALHENTFFNTCSYSVILNLFFQKKSYLTSYQDALNATRLSNLTQFSLVKLFLRVFVSWLTKIFLVAIYLLFLEHRWLFNHLLLLSIGNNCSENS